MGLADKYLPFYTVEERNKWQGDWELIEGIPYVLASPSIEHQRIVKNLIKDCKRCEIILNIDYYISEDTVIRPDLVVVCGDIGEKLVIPREIIFKEVYLSSVRMDEHIKYELYEREEVKYYCLAYLIKDRKHIKIFKLESGKYKKIFETLNGKFEFDLKDCSLKLDFSKIWQ